MKLLIRRIGICFLIVVTMWCGCLIADRKALNEQLIRLHIVANSDEVKDQEIKLKVRDAVLASIQEGLESISDPETAKVYLQENLPKIQNIANETLAQAGFDGEAVVSLCREAFDTRFYDTFTLPAGVYEALKITIGAGEGKNWWCVTFPSLCLPATTEGFEDAAVEAGLSDALTEALSKPEEFQIRFFLLESLGKLENILFEG